MVTSTQTLLLGEALLEFLVTCFTSKGTVKCPDIHTGKKAVPGLEEYLKLLPSSWIPVTRLV